MKNYQKVSLRVFISSAILLTFTSILGLGDFYVQIGIKRKILTYYEIDIILIIILVVTGIVCIGMTVEKKLYRVVINTFIVYALVLYVLHSFIVRIDTEYTEFYMENEGDRFFAIEGISSEIYRVRGGMFLQRIGDLKVEKRWQPISQGTYDVYWNEDNKMVIEYMSSGKGKTSREELNYK